MICTPQISLFKTYDIMSIFVIVLGSTSLNTGKKYEKKAFDITILIIIQKNAVMVF